jgi:hypothetical protein
MQAQFGSPCPGRAAPMHASCDVPLPEPSSMPWMEGGERAEGWADGDLGVADV